MTFRDDQDALHARADALQRENEALRQRVASLEGNGEKAAASGNGGEPAPSLKLKGRIFFIAGASLLVLGAIASYFTDIPAIVVPAAAFATMLIGAGVVSSLIELAAPDEVLIITGRHYYGADGRQLPFRVERRRVLRMPLIERVDRMSLGARFIEVAVSNAYSKLNIPLDITGHAMVRVCEHAPDIYEAIERFLGRDREIGVVAGETLQGVLREVVSDLTLQEMRANPDKLSASVMAQAERDLSRLGLCIDTFTIDELSDSRESDEG
ncbi:MAG: hypothetical protein KC503_00655 [Myxococcales bacterium]|nr:hypothetical protein [Myxococcales bacterium]